MPLKRIRKAGHHWGKAGSWSQGIHSPRYTESGRTSITWELPIALAGGRAEHRGVSGAQELRINEGGDPTHASVTLLENRWEVHVPDIAAIRLHLGRRRNTPHCGTDEAVFMLGACASFEVAHGIKAELDSDARRRAPEADAVLPCQFARLRVD